MGYKTVVHIPTHCSSVFLLLLFLQVIFGFLYPGFPQSLNGVHRPAAHRDPRHDDTEPQISPHTHIVLGQQISQFTSQNMCKYCTSKLLLCLIWYIWIRTLDYINAAVRKKSCMDSPILTTLIGSCCPSSCFVSCLYVDYSHLVCISLVTNAASAVKVLWQFVISVERLDFKVIILLLVFTLEALLCKESIFN